MTMTLEIGDLGLTIFQLAEIEDADPSLVDAWLARASDPEIHSPTGLFLSGLRSGQPPVERGFQRPHSLAIAERWIRNCGYLYDREDEAFDELYHRGPLKEYIGDVQVQQRMAALWREYRPLGIEVEEEARARGERNRKAREAVKVDPGG